MIRKEYQFLKNILTLGEISDSPHLCRLGNYYKIMTFLLKAYEFVGKQADYPVVLDPKTLNNEYKSFAADYLSD